MSTATNTSASTPASAPSSTPSSTVPSNAAPGTKVHPSASLYVGEISPEVTEGVLFEIFNQVGPVASIRVCRDTITRRSLGYAYVNFHSVVDAERALDTLNNQNIKGRPCRIMWSQRDPSIRKSGVGNIFIKNLDEDIGHKELHDTFSAFGNILSCKVATDADGNSRGYGFVHFESAEAAENAIQMVNDMMLGSKKIYVNHFKPRKEREAEKEASWTNVYVKDLEEDVTETELEELFGQYGEITSVAIMRGDDSKSRGFAFVNFAEHDNAAKAVTEIDGKELHGKPIYAGRAQKKAERQQELKKKFEQLKMDRLTKYQGINLYIKNLEDDIDEARLRKEFEPFGEIKSVKIMSDEKGASRGFGFVCFSTPEEAQRAINDMNSRILQGSTKPLYVALHEPKEMRRHKLAARHAGRGKGPAGRGIPGMPQMYPGQHPVYYAGGAPPPGAGGFLYPQQMMGGRPGVGVMPGQRGGSGSGSSGGSSGWGQQPGYPPAGYAPNMMGAPMQQGQQQGQQGQQRAGAAGGARPQQGGELTAQMLASLPRDRQKMMLGEKLYRLIEKTHPQLAGKITGMFLDSGWSIEELLSLTKSEEKLQEKINEAVKVLEEARKKNEESL